MDVDLRVPGPAGAEECLDQREGASGASAHEPGPDPEPEPEAEPGDSLRDVSPAVAGLARAVAALVSEGVLPVGLDAGERPIADVAALLQATAQVEAILAMRMAAAEAGGSLPFLSSGGMASQSFWSRTRARSLSRAGHRANDRPDISAAWQAGRITAEHVDAAAKGVNRLSDERAHAVLDGLTPLWGQVTPASVSTYCARARAIVDPPSDDPDLQEQKAHDARFLSFSVLDDTIHITGSLARLDGELLMNVVRSTAESMRVAGDGLTAAQRRADALMQLAAAGAAGAAGAAQGGTGPGAAISITLTADLEAVTGSGFTLPAADTRFALCDPSLTPVIIENPRPTGSAATGPPEPPPRAPWAPRPAPPEPGEPRSGSPGPGSLQTEPSATDPPGSRSPKRPDQDAPGITQRRLVALTAQALAAPQPLAVGRTQRVATPAQRRALAVRDSGCILPGCDVAAAHCQIHHLQPWTEGGTTDLPNLVSVCWAHHRQVDLGRWDIHPVESGHQGTPANNGAPFTIGIRPRSRWGRAGLRR